MPLAGDDGARGLAAATAIRLALGDRISVRDSARGGVQNPHQDEGSDNDVDLRTAPAIVASFAADANVVAAIGGLRRNVGDTDAAAAEARGLPMIVLARWSRAAGPATAVCVCVSPPHLVAFARSTASRMFGPRLLVVLIGPASSAYSAWPNRFGAVAFATVATPEPSLLDVERRARTADAVLVVADERPPALWRAGAFRRGFDRTYVRALAHRDFHVAPPGARRGDVLVIRGRFPDGPARRAFAQRYHAAAGFVPDDDALRAYAAAQVLRTAGTSRQAVRAALARRRFDTAAGRVVFDGDGYWASAVLEAAPA